MKNLLFFLLFSSNLFGLDAVKLNRSLDISELELILKNIGERIERINSPKTDIHKVSKNEFEVEAKPVQTTGRVRIKSNYNFLKQEFLDLKLRVEKLGTGGTSLPKGQSVHHPTNLPTVNLSFKTAQDDPSNIKMPDFLDATFERKDNSLNFYYGFNIPSKSKFKNYDLEFKNGYNIEMEYLRRIGFTILGCSLNSKYFENDKLTGIPVIDQMPASGNHFVFAPAITLGLKSKIRNLLFWENKLSLGVAFSHNELKLGKSSIEKTNNDFYYAFSSGLGFQWTQHFHSMLSYKYDGYQNSGEFGHQKFHQIEISVGADY